MAVRVQFRRGTASEWTSADVVLAVAELGFESDTGLFKIGDGVTSWTNLDYGNVSLSATSPITLTDGDIGLDESSITVTQSQVTNLTTDLADKQDKVTGVTDTEIGYLDGVTSGIQSQIDSKADTTTVNNELSSKQDIVSGVSDTEIGYLDGVTSSIQTQLNSKANLSGANFSGRVTASDSLEARFSVRNIYISTGDPSGGTDGDVWLKYEN